MREAERESEGDKTANKTCSYPLTLDHPIKLRSNQTSFSMPAMGAAFFIEMRLFFMYSPTGKSIQIGYCQLLCCNYVFSKTAIEKV